MSLRLDMMMNHFSAGDAFFQRAQQDIEDGRQEQAEEGHAQHAEEHRDAHGMAHFAPAPEDSTSGTTPMMKAKRGHQDRAQPQARGLDRGVDGRLRPAISSSRANSTIRMAFLQARPTSTNRPIWVKMLLSPPVSHTPAMAENRHIGTMRMIGQRQEQAFILRRQHQEDQQHAEREDEQRGVAGEDLLIGQSVHSKLMPLGRVSFEDLR